MNDESIPLNRRSARGRPGGFLLDWGRRDIVEYKPRMEHGQISAFPDA
jgi:hypothetical protein